MNDQFSRDSERRALYCNFGTLYPEGIESFSKVGSVEQLGAALMAYPEYANLWNKAQQDGNSVEDTIQDVLYAYEVHLNRLAFESQSQFACFYAFVKLKAQETRNLRWISSCIFLGRPQKDFNRWIKIF